MSLAQALARRRLVEPSGPSGAVIEGDYRYLLWRELREERAGGTILWVMLNPSTADGSEDDPTIRRCLGFAESWGYGAVEVVNLFAARATDPRDLDRFEDPVGPRNDAYLTAAARRASRIVCAWGAHRGTEPERRAVEVTNRIVEIDHLWCLGLTASGQPRHPLYLSADTLLQPYAPRVVAESFLRSRP